MPLKIYKPDVNTQSDIIFEVKKELEETFMKRYRPSGWIGKFFALKKFHKGSKSTSVLLPSLIKLPVTYNKYNSGAYGMTIKRPLPIVLYLPLINPREIQCWGPKRTPASTISSMCMSVCVNVRVCVSVPILSYSWV